MLDPLTHNRPFADKHDIKGMDGIPKYLGYIFEGPFTLPVTYSTRLIFWHLPDIITLL